MTAVLMQSPVASAPSNTVAATPVGSEARPVAWGLPAETTWRFWIEVALPVTKPPA